MYDIVGIRGCKLTSDILRFTQPKQNITIEYSSNVISL